MTGFSVKFQSFTGDFFFVCAPGFRLKLDFVLNSFPKTLNMIVAACVLRSHIVSSCGIVPVHHCHMAVTHLSRPHETAYQLRTPFGRNIFLLKATTCPHLLQTKLKQLFKTLGVVSRTSLRAGPEEDGKMRRKGWRDGRRGRYKEIVLI